jgi:ABC-type siderophore export system fused ATPase/permease subunit
MKKKNDVMLLSACCLLVMQPAWHWCSASCVRCRVTEALIYGTMMLGQALAFAPDFSQAKVSASKIMKLLQRQPKIFTSSSDPMSSDWV